MALNITINGFCYLDDGNIAVDDVKYQALFYPNGTASSPTTWNDVRVTEATGYWNFNLGDGDFLTQDGTALNNAKVVIVFWKGNTTNRNDSCSLLEQWGATEVTLDGSATYSFNTQIKSNILPILNWSFPTDGYVGVSYTAINNSYDVHTWDFGGVSMYHWRTRYGQNIQLVNTVDNSDYYWDDGDEDVDVAGTANRSHSWSASGNYDVVLVIEDECGATVTGTKPIRIEWNAPVPDITMTPAVPDPNEPVSFTYTGTDPNDRITSIDWTINDSGSYGNTNTTAAANRDDIVPHSDGEGTSWCGESANSGAFTNPGSHLVSIVVHWFDGFTSQTINYSETFNQRVFSGPTVDFDQDPAEATLASGVKFVNTSTSVSRVGTGLPDCGEYDWTWTEDGVPTEYNDKPYSWELEKTPGSVDSKAKLCANWSNGWENYSECVEKDVVFGTIVTITEEDCFYNLNIIGTSGDGSVTGYSWTVYSGTGSTGPWTETWYSPTGINQNDKKVCFTAVGWYKIEGFVYGTGATTSDDETLYINVVCPTTTSGIEVISHIWNGTGAGDVGGDWTHSQYGVESSAAKHTGTNGLDATGMRKTDKIFFTDPDGTVNANIYDTLVMWVNVKEWQSTKDVTVELHKQGGANVSVNLSRYLTTDYLDQWQKVVIPLTHFGNSGSFQVDKLRLWSNGNIGFYLDDIYFSMGAVVGVEVCYPEVTGDEFGKKTTRAETLVPSGKASSGLVPSGQASADLVPSGKGTEEMKPSGRPAFPSPRNL